MTLGTIGGLRKRFLRENLNWYWNTEKADRGYFLNGSRSNSYRIFLENHQSNEYNVYRCANAWISKYVAHLKGIKNNSIFKKLSRSFPSDIRSCELLITELWLNCACATDGSKLLKSPPARQPWIPCSEPPTVFQDVSTPHDWPVNSATADFPIRLK